MAIRGSGIAPGVAMMQPAECQQTVAGLISVALPRSRNWDLLIWRTLCSTRLWLVISVVSWELVPTHDREQRFIACNVMYLCFYINII